VLDVARDGEMIVWGPKVERTAEDRARQAVPRALVIGLGSDESRTLRATDPRVPLWMG
jgi:hypothetical protein